MPIPTKKTVPPPPTFAADGSLAGQVCSICQTAVIAGEQVLRCPTCELPFHGECWTENGGCSAYGCKSAPPTIKPTGAEAIPISNAWGEEKTCPACNKKIKAEATKCRFCGAQFDSRDVVTKAEYAARQYDGIEFNKARNKVVMLFLLSAAGCLAPLGLLLCGLLVAQKELMGIDYRRLPHTLKALVWSAIGISTLLLVIAAMVLVLDS
jgi:hypothetical protein